MTLDPSEERRDRKLRKLARTATSATPTGAHVDAPILALLRDGDFSDDIADAVTHVAECCDCRARLTEGEVSHRQVVVMAIEAPRASSVDIEKAAEGTKARLVGRGDGRWTAVIDAEKSETFRRQLSETGEVALVSRLAHAPPLGLYTSTPRGMLPSIPPPGEQGTAAAEVQAWAQVARAPKQRTRATGFGWVAIAIVAVLGSIVIAYFLAIR